jgi:hypothetical protein
MAEPFEPLDYDDSEAVSFDNSPIPDADYTLQLVDFRTGKSQAGNGKVTWEFKVVEDAQFGERRIWHDTVTAGRGAGMFNAVLSAMGYDPKEYLAEFGNKITFEALAGLIGERVDARVKTDVPTEETLAKYPNAKPRNKISRFV